MTQLKDTLPPLPVRMQRLAINDRGFPVPWFVEWIDGKPDFRVMDGRKLIRAIKEHLCWICGLPTGSYLAFTIGPMCAINRVSAEPPSHRECAEFAAQACPFLTTPKEKRQEHRLPEDGTFSATGLTRNPGVALVWITKSYKVIRGMDAEVLFRIGDPTETLWFCEGRPATRAEVQHSVDTGCPMLMNIAIKDGPEAVAQLQRQQQAAERYYPAG